MHFINHGECNLGLLFLHIFFHILNYSQRATFTVSSSWIFLGRKSPTVSYSGDKYFRYLLKDLTKKTTFALQKSLPTKILRLKFTSGALKVSSKQKTKTSYLRVKIQGEVMIYSMQQTKISKILNCIYAKSWKQLQQKYEPFLIILNCDLLFYNNTNLKEYLEYICKR